MSKTMTGHELYSLNLAYKKFPFGERLLSYWADINHVGYLAPPILQGGTPLFVAASVGKLD